MSLNDVNCGICPICTKTFDNEDDVCHIRQKGADGINHASTQRSDSLVVTPGTKVHISCRRYYINPRNMTSEKSETNGPSNSVKRSARMSLGPFNSKTDCFFCANSIVLENSDYSYVKTDTFAKTILESCDDRSDNWSFCVKGRIEYFGSDLHAADCLYHHSCSRNFRTGRDVPLMFQSAPEAKRKKSGRPKALDLEQAFSKVCSYLETNDEEQLTIFDLSNKMKEFLSDGDSLPYGNQYLKSKLKDRYGNSLHIAEGEGLHDIVTMKEKASEILRSYFKHQEGDEESQKRYIIETAARLIKSDIKTYVPSVTDQYPSSEMLTLDSTLAYIPATLHILLDSLFVGKDNRRKVASIGQSIIQAVRPRATIVPLQIGLAVQTHHLHRSKFLVDTLHEMGFCSSYGEVLRFEKNAASCVAPDILGMNVDLQDTTVLFAADNVDHNIITIDGKGTFHGMGMVAALTPGKKMSRTIMRRNTSELNIIDNTRVAIIDLQFANHVCRSMRYQDLPNLTPDFDMRIDIFWELAFSFRQETPNWPGMMHTLYREKDHPGQSSVIFLPMIDMYSGDKICILSTLMFLSNLATKHKFSPVVTFDQPLYWKAAELIIDSPQNSPLKTIVLRLGCFHTFMNLLGAIGTLMEGTGLAEILGTIYGENAVTHMMTGKSVQRAFRGHLLVDKCLNGLILTDMRGESPEFGSLVDHAEDMYSEVLAGERTLESTYTSDLMAKIKEEIDKKKNELRGRSKTSQLWLNYQKMIQVARMMITADRTGSWTLHLRAVANCLPMFAAAGHFNYLKSAHYYVQEMSGLEFKNPGIYKNFTDGYHVIRRSDKFWAGLSSDLVIEQTLMRSLKATGGLTRGSGMTEEQRSLWTMSMPVTSEYNSVMQEFTNLSFATSEQHKDSSEARVKRDTSDMNKITEKLAACTPYSPDPLLRNVVNGVVASPEVNVHEYESVGKKVMANMIGHAVFTVSFKRKHKATTMGEISKVKIAPEQTIDAALLFQRFLVVSKTGELELAEVMGYELSPFPPALFEARDVFLKADKPQLAHAITDHAGIVSSDAVKDCASNTEQYVLDGGSLVHRIPWKTGDSYGTIARAYADFTTRHYGSAIVVFDGYGGGPCIKDNTHQRRGKNVHPVVRFNEDTVFSGKKEEFLSRDCNKQELINLVSEELRKSYCTVINAPGDADVHIAKAAVKSSHRQSTTLIGEDTDLLVLLLHYADINSRELYFRSDNAAKTKVYNIKQLKVDLGKDICTQLLFLHAYTGCDSTSRIFGIGKKTVFQKLVKGNPTLNSCANTFLVPNQPKELIEEFGIKTMSVIFGGRCNDSLALLRYKLFVKKIANAKSFVTPERLPPTQASTKYHSLRTYYQVMAWLGSEEDMDVTDWGWKLENNHLVPVMSNMEAAPNNLLKLIHCNCGTACSTLRCTCRGYGLSCNSVCGPCQVDTCNNPYNESLDSEAAEE